MDFKTAQDIASQAYIKAWRECGIKFSPPIGNSVREKHWSRRLREAWPEFTSVAVNQGVTPERRKWCDENPGSYWHNGNGSKWYFETRSTALLFKLTFGGELSND